MPLGTIARVSGGPGNWQIVDWMEGCTLADAPTGQDGWVNVIMSWPTVDNCTQVMTTPVLAIESDGSRVSWTLAVENLHPAIARGKLKQLATQASIAKAVGGLTLPNGIQLATDSAQAGLIVDAIEALERGWATEPYEIQSLNGAWISLAKTDLLAAGQAIAQFRIANYAARKACIDAINAGAITSSTQVLASV